MLRVEDVRVDALVPDLHALYAVRLELGLHLRRGDHLRSATPRELSCELCVLCVPDVRTQCAVTAGESVPRAGSRANRVQRVCVRVWARPPCSEVCLTD